MNEKMKKIVSGMSLGSVIYLFSRSSKEELDLLVEVNELDRSLFKKHNNDGQKALFISDEENLVIENN